MRYLVISDLHEDYRYLENLLETISDYGGYDSIWFLGDAIGHGNHKCCSDAQRTISLLQEIEAICIKGNWEMWLKLDSGKDQSRDNPRSRWEKELQNLREKLAPDLLKWVDDWEWKKIEDGFTLTHGCPYSRHEDSASRLASISNSVSTRYTIAPWETYLWPEKTLVVNHIFLTEKVDTPHLVVGHTHGPGYFHYNDQALSRWYPLTPGKVNVEIEMDRNDARYVFNPGALSDVDKRVPWPTALLLDTDLYTFRFIRVDYSTFAHF